MQLALEQARKATGLVSPNPAVGAVIVKDGVVVGRGCTQPPGSAHAEIMALREAGERARDAVLYVTLEPCCHYGRTPPCTEAIIKAGISEVHLAVIDPNPVVAGKGIAQLESAGIITVAGECREEAEQVIEAYIRYITTGLPFVVVKYAASLDGRIACRSGDSRWITGESARRRVHELRAASDAIMVGINTVLTDDPRLTARFDDERIVRQPLRVVIDGRGRMPCHAAMLREPGSTLVVVGERVNAPVRRTLEQAGAEVLVVPQKGDNLELEVLMRELGQRQVTSMLVEGGGTLTGSLFDAHLVDKVAVFIAPVIIGGREAVPSVGGLGAETMAEALRLDRVNIEILDSDIMVTGYCR